MRRITTLPGLFVLLFVASCHISQKKQTMLPIFDKQGHRGCRGLMPENTISAMLKAIDLGVTTLEMDAVITKDKQVILSHEPFFSHEITTTSANSFINEKEERQFNIYQMTFGETQQYDVGLKPHPRFPRQQKIPARKPLLANVIDSVEKYCRERKLGSVFYNIETKCQPATDNVFHPSPEEFVDLVMKVIDNKGIANRVVIQSFDFRTLQFINRKYPGVKTAALVEDYDKNPLESQLKSLGFKPSIYSPHYSLVNERLLTNCHQLGIKVIPWTVNEREGIERLREMGVDGIITDYPNLF